MHKVREAIQRLAQPAQTHELLLPRGAALPLPILPPQGQAIHFAQIPHVPRAYVLPAAQSEAPVVIQGYDTAIMITAKPY